MNLLMVSCMDIIHTNVKSYAVHQETSGLYKKTPQSLTFKHDSRSIHVFSHKVSIRDNCNTIIRGVGHKDGYQIRL